MARGGIIVLLVSLLIGCGETSERMDHPEDPRGRYREQIAAAQRVLEQKEDWAARAEWEVLETAGGWEVIAWRVEHPQAKGGARYVPWGYATIELDSRLVAVHYHRKG